MTEIKVYKSIWKAIRLMLLCSLFVVPAVYSLISPEGFEPAWISWMCILFFGLGYPVGLLQIVDRRPQIIINETGIFDRTTGKDFINWQVIEDAYLNNVYGQIFICLVLKEDFKPTGHKLNKVLGFQELNIAASFSSVKPQKLLELILAMRSADFVKKEEVIKLTRLIEH